MALAEKLYEHGLVSPEVIKDASVDDLMEIEGMSPEEAEKIIREAAGVENSDHEASESDSESDDES
jgi:ERCC4-type nuclease